MGPIDDKAVLGLLAEVDIGLALLRPVLGHTEHMVLDAELVWASARSASAWGHTAGVRASDVLPDFQEWVGVAGVAWRGVDGRHLVEPRSRRAGWEHATSLIRRVDDHLVEIMLEHSGDEELVRRVHDIEAGFLSLLEDLPITVIFSTVGHGRIEFVSSRAVELTGYPLSELTRLADWVRVVDPEDLEVAGTVRELLFRDGEFEMPGRIVRPGGEVRYVTFRMVSRAPQADEPRRYLITLTDTTEQRLLAERAEESARLASLSRTAGSFGHEFSSLLQIITGNLDTIERGKSPEHTAKAIVTAREAAGRATNLLAGLVAFASAKPDSIEPVSIPRMCEATSALLRERLPQNIGLSIDIPDHLPLVLIAPSAMQQIMFQLVDNAAEAMPDGGDVRITVREQPHAACHLNDSPGPGCWVSVTVADTGRGIERSRLGFVWEPFHTTRTGPNTRGSGLGLSVVHGAAHQYDGHVTLESHVGVGTSVTVYLKGVPGSTG